MIDNYRIIDTEYSDVMHQSYIDYSMSVIMDRAVPDIRDGLKPVQRRIIYDMSKLGITSDKPFRKVARIVGDTMGKYHPHGDASIEDALVVQAQDFKRNYPLIDGHGNFGSIEGDQHAAARYIESKLQSFTEKVFLSELPFDSVDFRDNYDATETEPEVLPVLVPNFLLNGSEGIAVGMVTSTPPHNLSEVLDAEVAYLKNPKIKTQELMSFMPGPDFPTGGIISNKSELLDIYETGVGKIKIRGKVEVEKIKGGKVNLIITEIPYTMIGSGISKFLNDVAGLVEDKTITDITDISNQSSKEGIRIVIELRKNADVNNIKNILYKKTKLEDTFSVNMLAIADKTPVVCSLPDVFKYHTKFLYDIYTRKYKYLLKKEKDQLEIQEGLIKAIGLIDLIISVLRGSKNQKDAKKCLMTGDISNIKLKTKTLEKQAAKLSFTEKQTDAILNMRLSRLIGLELEALVKEKEKLLKDIQTHEGLLKSKEKLKKDIINTLLKVKKEFSRKRSTQLLDIKEEEIKEVKIQETDVVVLIDRFGYVKTVDKSVYERNKETADKENQTVLHTKNTKTVFFITDYGKFYKVPILDLPYGNFRSKSSPIDNFVGKTFDQANERSVYYGILEDMKKYVLFGTSCGFIKKMESSELTDIRRNGAQVIKLEDNDILKYFIPIKSESHLVIITENKFILKAVLKNIPVKKKSARGVIGIKLKDDDKVSSYTIYDQSVPVSVNLDTETSISLNEIKATPTGRAGKCLA